MSTRPTTQGEAADRGPKPGRRLFVQDTAISRIAWSPDGEVLALPCREGSIRLWSRRSGSLLLGLKGHSDAVLQVAWSPDGKTLASASADRTVRLWPATGGPSFRAFSGHEDWVTGLAWSPDGVIVASSSEDRTVRLWHTQTGQKIRTLAGHDESVNALAWSPDGVLLASASDDRTIHLWDAATGQSLKVLRGHAGLVLDLAWSPDGKTLASASEDLTVRLWDRARGWRPTILEGHMTRVGALGFSADGRFLATKCEAGRLRFWDASTGELLEDLGEPASPYRTTDLAFHPTLPILASLGEAGKSVRLWDLAGFGGVEEATAARTVHYTNAKVLLVGDSGVGKSGLGLVLSGKPFEATESTHGRKVWALETCEVPLADGRRESRETLLWDLAGQPGYRLIHQLHLNEVAVALIVFDSRGELDPFGGVRHWCRALRQATGDGPPPRLFLVAARSDRGGIGVSRERIDCLIREMGFEGYFETSAREGWNVAELAAALRDAIAWEAMPRVCSSALFQEIKSFLVKEKQAGRVLSPLEDIYRAFGATNPAPVDDLRKAFETCVSLVESRGLIKRLSFGNLVLLQPELLDAYASALVHAAKDEPDGLGSLMEEVALSGRFRMSKDERLLDPDQEKLLLLATSEGLLRQEIALREQTEEGPRLVFPSQMTREHPDFPDPTGKTLVLGFEGPVLNIYATLSVRISHSGAFAKKEMWKNAATFSARVGGTCGLVLRELEEGRAELLLFFDRAASEQTRFQFEEYVFAHLKRRSLAESLKRRRLFTCSNCEEPISDGQATRRRQLGHLTIRCPVCDHEINLLSLEERLAPLEAAVLPEMDRVADDRREREMASFTLEGKMATLYYDVLICHNSGDKAEVIRISDALKSRGILPWIDEREMRPGLSWYDFLEQQFGRIKAAAVFVGVRGVGPSQRQEINVLLNEFVPSGRPVIPVLLSDAPLGLELPIFLRHMTWVDFRKTQPDPLQALIWGITQSRRDEPAASAPTLASAPTPTPLIP